MNITYAQQQIQHARDTSWLGFKRHNFLLGGRNCILVEPHEKSRLNNWIWRTEFFGHEPQADSMLLSKGYYLAYIDVQNMYGAPKALDIMDEFYLLLTSTFKLHNKVVLEGFSRGGLFALNWAARNPHRTASIYLDAPVCDFKGWPGNKGKGPGSEEDWKRLKDIYGFASDAEALAYRYNPVDNLRPLAEYKIPILSVCGTADEVVPMEEHSSLLQKRYRHLGGKMKIITKKGVGHHPHSLKDPTPIVSFIVKNSLK